MIPDNLTTENLTAKNLTAKNLARRALSLALVFMLTITAVFAAASVSTVSIAAEDSSAAVQASPVIGASYGGKWKGTRGKSKKVFRAYVEYKWEPDFSNTQAKLTVTGFGVQCLSNSKALSFSPGSAKKASLKMSITPRTGKKKLVKDRKASRLKFPNAKKGAKAKFGSATYIFKKTSSKQKLTVTFAAAKGKQDGKYPKAWKGASKGTLVLTIPAARKDVFMTIPENSRGDTATATVVNTSGKKYKYTMFRQIGEYGDFTEYMKNRGCSTCALTTILNATKGFSLTPEKTLKVIKKVNKKAYEENFSKKPSKQMPIALAGICKVLDRYKVTYKYGTGSKTELTNWLKEGNPAIITFGDGSAGGLSESTHTVLLLGIQNGKVVIGDSTLKSTSIWGSDGLVKHGRLTVANMLSYIDCDNWDVATGNFFYAKAADRGYILIKK